MLLRYLVLITGFVFLSAGSLKAETLKFGILPVIDTLPLQVAVHEGFFREAGLDVELVPFTSAMERNTAVHAKQLDGYFGDLIATLLLVENGLPIKILTVSYATNLNFRMFGIVTAPGSNKNPGDTLSIAISKASIIEYLLSYVKDLPSANQYSFQPVEIKQMPIRLQMLLSDEIDSALLPEPLLTLAISKGARLLATDQTLDQPLTILNIYQDKLKYKTAFLRAYTRAVEAINSTPEKYRNLMAKTCRIPKPLVKSFPVYQYPMPRLPSEQEVAQVESWMQSNRLLKQKIAYSRLVP